MTDTSTTSIYIPHTGWLEAPDNDDVVTFLREGWFEYREAAFLWLYVRPHDIVIDCGAHVGLFSVLAGKLLKGYGRIISVEPNPATAKLLERNLADNDIGNSKVVEAAVYHSDGTATLHLHSAEKAAYDSIYVEKDFISAVEVPTLTLDRLLEDENIARVDFLKLDIEGAEIDALAGASRSVADGKLPLIMVEATEANLQASGRSTDDLRAAFERAGFRLFAFDPISLQLVPYRFDGPIWYDNLFACADPSLVNQRLRDATPEHARIAADLCSHGRAAQELRDKLEAANRDLEAANRDLIASTADVAQLRTDLEKVRAELVEAKDETELKKTRIQLEQAKAVAHERLLLLRRSHLQHQISERRINSDLLPRWPLRLALKYGLVRHPAWLRYQSEPSEDAVARHIADNPVASETTGSGQGPRISVLLCTYNPCKDLLAWTLESIQRQTMDASNYEVVLVDNNSQPPIKLSDYPAAAGLPIRVVREVRQGLIYARVAGIVASTGPLIVFVDDDNHLDPDYLQYAEEIADCNPEIGLFGGIARGRLERNVWGWKQQLLPYLGVRDHGGEVITSTEPSWGPWEPIGAGMTTRRDVAESYVDFVENSTASGGLGRKGNELLSCEDSLFARVANWQGYACSYQPALKLDHFISGGRLTSRYLFRLIYGMGRSYVRLERVLGRGSDVKQIGLRNICARLVYRVSSDRIAGAFRWAWDLGYRYEAARGADTETAQESHSARRGKAASVSQGAERSRTPAGNEERAQ